MRSIEIKVGIRHQLFNLYLLEHPLRHHELRQPWVIHLRPTCKYGWVSWHWHPMQEAASLVSGWLCFSNYRVWQEIPMVNGFVVLSRFNLHFFTRFLRQAVKSLVKAVTVHLELEWNTEFAWSLGVVETIGNPVFVVRERSLEVAVGLQVTLRWRKLFVPVVHANSGPWLSQVWTHIVFHMKCIFLEGAVCSLANLHS